MNLDYACQEIDALSSEQRAAWSRLQQSQLHLNQPFLSLEFAEAANEFRGAVEVLTASQTGQTVALLPFHRQGKNRAVPIAPGMNEYQAILREDSTEVDLPSWLSAASLKEFCFDHMRANERPFGVAAHKTGPCPVADLSCGFEAYCSKLQQRGSRTMRETSRKRRKLEREVGEVRFQLASSNSGAFDALVRWKQAQHKSTNVYDTFSHQGVISFLDKIRRTETDNFTGALSALYAGDQLVAVHLGLRTSQIAHMWIPTYDKNFARFSPGAIMLAEMTKALAECGVQRLDFGPGSQRYKQSFSTDSYPVSIGEFVHSPYQRWLKRHYRQAKQSLKESWFSEWLRAPTRWLHARSQFRTFRSRT